MEYKTVITEDTGICADAIKNGETVAFATDTVYGLGADYTNEQAVAKIFEAKGRPADKPVSILVSDIEMAKTVAGEWTEEMDRLARRFWPGAFTMVVPKSDTVPDIVSAGKATVGVRMPASYKALELIKSCRVGLATPSANLSGRPSPTKAEHVLKDMKGRIPYILRGGECGGLESTVYDVTTGTVLRQGKVMVEDIAGIVGEVKVAENDTKYAHYNPTYRVVLVKGSNISEKIEELCKSADKEAEKYVILDIEGELKGIPGEIISFEGDINEAASKLYDLLLDLEGKVDLLVVAAVNPSGIGRVLMDRLEQAAAGNIIEN